MGMMDGYLLIDKPAGISSFGVVARVRRLLSEQASRKVKIGHTGTLDPFATGLLILVIGSYTKRAAEFSKLDKVYEAELKLGFTSTTADPEGEISKISTHQPTHEEVNEVLNKFIGEIMQTPPSYSAIKVGGQRAYKLARAGKEVKIEPRKVQIYTINNVKYTYPSLSFEVHVSSGTYIRSLAVDIGESLGVGAYLSALRRIGVGSFSIQTATNIEDLPLRSIQESLQN
jgi:tRNA pseudouridine55 synthase